MRGQSGMVVLIDTNVIIDFLVARKPFYEASYEIVSRCISREINGYIAFHSIPNLWYILRKAPEEQRREWLSDVCGFLQVAGAGHEDVFLKNKIQAGKRAMGKERKSK